MTDSSNPGGSADEAVSSYQPPPRPQSAYPTPEEGGFDGGFTPIGSYGPPGPGYADPGPAGPTGPLDPGFAGRGAIDEAPRPAVHTARLVRFLVPVMVGAVLAMVLVLGLMARPIQATVVAALCLLGAVVVVSLRRGPMRSVVLLGAAIPALVLIYYWAVALIGPASG